MLFRSDRKSTRLNSSHLVISYAVFCLKKKKRRTLAYECRARIRSRILTSVRFVRRSVRLSSFCCFFFFFNDTATTEISTLSLHDALPISLERTSPSAWSGRPGNPVDGCAQPPRWRTYHRACNTCYTDLLP